MRDGNSDTLWGVDHQGPGFEPTYEGWKLTNKEILKRLEEIEARAEKATPGPWEAKSGYAESDNGCTLIGAGKPIAYFHKRISPGGTLLHRRDCEFAASAREDVPWLCKTVRQLVARLEEVETQCAAMREALKEISRTEQDEKPDGTILGYLVHDAYEMCGIADAALRHEAGLVLLDRLRRLEVVAEAAQELVADLSPMPSRPRDWSASWTQLKRALAALEDER